MHLRHLKSARARMAAAIAVPSGVRYSKFFGKGDFGERYFYGVDRAGAVQPARVPHHIEDRREHWSRYMDPLPNDDPIAEAKTQLAYMAHAPPQQPAVARARRGRPQEDEAMTMDQSEKMFALREIMAKAHELAALACPNGVTTNEALDLLIDIQIAALKGLELPEDTPLTDGSIESSSLLLHEIVEPLLIKILRARHALGRLAGVIERLDCRPSCRPPGCGRCPRGDPAATTRHRRFRKATAAPAANPILCASHCDNQTSVYLLQDHLAEAQANRTYTGPLKPAPGGGFFAVDVVGHGGLSMMVP